MTESLETRKLCSGDVECMKRKNVINVKENFRDD